MFSDRARVRRRGRAPGKAGIELVRFPSLPGAVTWTPIRVSATGGRVLRVEATPVQRERLSIAQAAKLLDALDAVDDRLVEMDDRRAGDDWEVGVPARAHTRAARARGQARGPQEPGPRRRVVVEGAGLHRRAVARAPSGRLLKLEGERRELIKERDRLRRRRPGAEPRRLLRPRRRRRRDRRRGARRRRAGAGVLRSRRALEAGLRPALRVGARADPRRDRRGRRAGDRRGLDRRHAAAVDRDARARDRPAGAADLDAGRAERVRAAAAPAPAAAGRAAAAVPPRRRRPRADARAIDAEIVRARLAQASGSPTRRRPTSGDGGSPTRATIPAQAAPRCASRKSTPEARHERAPSASSARRPHPAAAPPAMPPPPPAGRVREDDEERAEVEEKPAPAFRQASAPSRGSEQRAEHAPPCRWRSTTSPRRARAGAVRSVPAGGQRGRPRLRLPGADEGDDRQLGQAGPHPARVADVPGHRLPRGDAGAGADRVPARARAQRRQAAAAARAGDDLRRRRAGRRRRDPDHRPGRRHRVPAGRRPGREAGAPGRPEHEDHRRDHEVGGDDLRRPDPGRQLQEAEGHRRDRRSGAAQPARQGAR